MVLKKFDTSEFGKVMDVIAPLSLMESWDNSGFQIDLGNNIEKVLVALELTEEVVNEGISKGVDIILTHHPMFFGDVNHIMSTDPKGKMVIKLIQNNISLYSSHTPFDIAHGGNNDYLGKLLGFNKLFLMDENDGFCRAGIYEEPKSILEIATILSDKIGVDKCHFRLAGNKEQRVSKIAWCTGSGTDFIQKAAELGYELFITGDLKYHQAQDSLASGISVLDIGHFGSEIIFTENATSLLDKIISARGGEVSIIPSEVNVNPFTMLV